MRNDTIIVIKFPKNKLQISKCPAMIVSANLKKISVKTKKSVVMVVMVVMDVEGQKEKQDLLGLLDR